MFTQACRSGRRDSNPAQWAEPPPIPNIAPEVPTPEEIRALIDELSAAILRAQMDQVEERAVIAHVDLVDDPYVFTDALDGSEPWKPDAVSQYFGRMRKRAGLDKVQIHQLRKFMETYGHEMGYSVTQVAMRAGHDPSIAAKHYNGRVSETDRALAEAVASLIAPRAISWLAGIPGSTRGCRRLALCQGCEVAVSRVIGVFDGSSRACLGTTIRWPSRSDGIDPCRTHSYAVVRAMPSAIAAWVTVMVSVSG